MLLSSTMENLGNLGHHINLQQNFVYMSFVTKDLQWNPSGKARNVTLKFQNSVHFHAPFFTNHVYFTPRDRPPLLKGHHHGWPLQRGSTVFFSGFKSAARSPRWLNITAWQASQRVCVNSLTDVAGIVWENKVNTVAADTLAPCVTRSSGTMVLTI